MNSRQLALLSAAALAIILVATWLGLSRKPGNEPSALLYPDLKGQLAKVSGVRVYKGAEQLVVEAARAESGWTIKQRDGYPGDAAKINGLLLALEEAKLREEKTSNLDNYAALGVQDLSADATGSRIELDGVEPQIKLIVGKSGGAADGAYVRRVGESKSWLVSGQFTVPGDATAWLKRDLLDIGADRMQEAQVQLSNSRYTTAKAQRADANFDVTPIPKGRELSSVSAANAVAQTLVALQLDDVRPASELANEKSIGVARYRTFDGLTLDITGYSSNDKHWITAQVGFDEALAKRFHLPAKAADDKAPAKEDTSLRESIDKVRAEADALSKRLNGWAFAIPQYKYDAIFKPLDELLLKK